MSFRYIERIQTTAYVCTRRITLFKLRSNRLWWHGPEWLQTPIKSCPTWNFPEINQNTLIHDPCNTIMYETSFVVNEIQKNSTRPFRHERSYILYSTKTDTVRRKSQYSGSPSVKELSDAKLRWEIHVQRRNFAQIFE